MRMPTPLKEVRHIGMRGEELVAFLNTLRVLDEVQFKAIENALHMVVPSVTGIEVGVNSYGEVEFSIIEGQVPISSRLVSEGTLRVLGLLALSSAKDAPALIGFEEPESAVHPRRLRLIALLLKTRTRHGTQAIVTTHSPILADLIPHESLYVCRKPHGQTIVEPFSNWKLQEINEPLDGEEELSVSGRIQRGDFDV